MAFRVHVDSRSRRLKVIELAAISLIEHFCTQPQRLRATSKSDGSSLGQLSSKVSIFPLSKEHIVMRYALTALVFTCVASSLASDACSDTKCSDGVPSPIVFYTVWCNDAKMDSREFVTTMIACFHPPPFTSARQGAQPI